jgi:hypothetical protein
MANWDTEETSRIIANDEGLYHEACRLSRFDNTAYRMKTAFSDSVEAYPYSDINMKAIDWNEIATEYID